ncbi:MAG: hypothetical protein ABIB47_05145 [Candidatus Woesearchaeota archaeon]
MVKKIIFLVGILVLIVFFISGCSDLLLYKLEPDQEVEYQVPLITTKDIKKCLEEPNQAWDGPEKQTIIVRFDGKSTDFIYRLADDFGIIGLEHFYTSDDMVFMKFNIQDNLPVEKICGFLNSDKISTHYPEEGFTTQ